MVSGSGSPEGVPAQFEHRSIRSAIEESYLDMVEASTSLTTQIQTGQGNMKLKFVPFFQAFSLFFSLTSVYKDLERQEEYRDLLSSIEQWMNETSIDRNRALRGVALMRRYQKAVASELLPLRR